MERSNGACLNHSEQRTVFISDEETNWLMPCARTHLTRCQRDNPTAEPEPDTIGSQETDGNGLS